MPLLLVPVQAPEALAEALIKAMLVESKSWNDVGSSSFELRRWCRAGALPYEDAAIESRSKIIPTQ
jgi:hypothetical protein